MPSRPTPYHHGRLRQAVIDMAVQLADESGHEQISLREVARRLGVSSGAPFRHFKNHEALMAAIAEEATVRLRLGIERDLHGVPNAPISRLKALGHSFLDWALQHPAQFRIVSARRLYHFNASPILNAHFNAVRERTVAMIEAAQAAGSFSPGNAASMALSLRAAAYGLARMHVDGQLPQWQVEPGQEGEAVKAALDRIIDAMAQAGGHLHSTTPNQAIIHP
jgi:AcrR family transcriptional regulator